MIVTIVSRIFFVLLPLIIIGQENDEPACFCLDYYHSKPSIHGELLELNIALKASDLKPFLDSLFKDHRDKIDAKLKLNVNKDNHYVNGPQIGFSKDQDTALINRVLFEQLEKTNEPIRFVWSRKGVKFKNDTTNFNVLYALEKTEEPLLTSVDVRNARVSMDPYNNEVLVSLNMTRDGTEKIETISIKHIGDFIAIVSNNKVMSAPIINGPIRGGGIFIMSNFTKAEAEFYRNLLNCDAYSITIGWEEFEKEMKRCD